MDLITSIMHFWNFLKIICLKGFYLHEIEPVFNKSNAVHCKFYIFTDKKTHYVINKRKTGNYKGSSMVYNNFRRHF